MKNSVQTLLALLAFGATALVAQAQPALKILVVDMAKLYDSHYMTEEQNAKLRGDEQKANEELERLNKDGTALVAEYTELTDQSKNPALTQEARANAEGAAQRKLEEIQRKQNEVATFRQNTARSLQQRIKTFREVMLEEISKIASDVAKRRGATILMDKSGPSLIGVSSLIYTDPAYDITEEVMAEINKNRPAGMPQGKVDVGTPTPMPENSGVTVPGLTPKK